VIDGHHLHVMGRSSGNHARPQIHVRGANDKALHALRTQIVDGRHDLFAIFRAHFCQGEALFGSSLIGEFPFVLELGLLWPFSR
ncbi:MAG: hypothetical protein L0H65_13405, partial [Pseudorhodobacter sp.]